MKMNLPFEILLFFGGMFFYGLRNMAAKWMVVHTARLLQKLFIKTEQDLALYLHHRNKAYNKRHRH